MTATKEVRKFESLSVGPKTKGTGYEIGRVELTENVARVLTGVWLFFPFEIATSGLTTRASQNGHFDAFAREWRPFQNLRNG